MGKTWFAGSNRAPSASPSPDPVPELKPEPRPLVKYLIIGLLVAFRAYQYHYLGNPGRRNLS
ncbi:hypothetical protein MPTK1_2g21080 [Marchantia polymorpha subsp. ruderalis]|nr:hypothetical protein Mp_2g21080 [Marchantia polymorpha subsp. ruderalis]